MRRRSIISACAVLGTAAALVVAPGVARAQPTGKVWRIGYLSQGAGPNANIQAFIEGLRSLGYVEGRNLLIEYRWANESLERLEDLVKELVQLKVDVIVADRSSPVAAAKRATSTIPIVMPAPSDPVGSGFVASLAHPGGNLTGMSMMSTDLAGKDLELVRELSPKATRVALLGAGFSTGRLFSEQVQAAARKTGITLAIEHLEKPEALAGALGALLRERPQLLIVQHSGIANIHRKQIVEFAALHRLPAIYGSRGFADAGGLMSYGPSLLEMVRHAAYFVDRIFKGAKPADLPVEQPTKFEMVINLKTAKALGLTVPYALRLQATELIE